jgi:hypothetical protein
MSKFLKYSQFLNEVGEIRNPYKYERVDGPDDLDTVYRFTNKSGIEYLITLSRTQKDMVNVDFGIINGRKIDMQTVANVGDPLTIFSTVFDALTKYVKANPEVTKISYDPVTNFDGDKRREKIYEQYMKKNFNVIDSWKLSPMTTIVFQIK